MSHKPQFAKLELTADASPVRRLRALSAKILLFSAEFIGMSLVHLSGAVLIAKAAIDWGGSLFRSIMAACGSADGISPGSLKRLLRLVRDGKASLKPATTRPIVLFQSDDWGRCGAPSRAAIERLKRIYPNVGKSPWDYYGLESREDLLRLGDTLASLRDHDGRRACFTANFVMANADTARMRAEGYRDLHLVSLLDGFPAPWMDHHLGTYRENVSRGAFYPGLHGPTHFNGPALLQALQSESAAGQRARDLFDEDVPYLASVTPEFNLALVTRERDEVFLCQPEQERWISAGVSLFREAFGMRPRSACAPGYRANHVTFRLWRQHGIEAAQVVGRGALGERDGLLVFERNVHFEPALDSDAIASALAAAEAAVARGFPIIVSSHSINYISRFLGRAAQARDDLRTFCHMLVSRFPDLHFLRGPELIDAVSTKATDFFRMPTAREIAARFAA